MMQVNFHTKWLKSDCTSKIDILGYIKTSMAYDEVYWWKTQLRNYVGSRVQPPMKLPKVNTLTGHYVPVGPSIHDELNFRYSQYSKSYWAGVRERQKAYIASQPS